MQTEKIDKTQRSLIVANKSAEKLISGASSWQARHSKLKARQHQLHSITDYTNSMESWFI